MQYENHENYKNPRIPGEDNKIMKIIEFHVRIMQIMKIIELQTRISKIMKVIPIQTKMTKTMKNL